MNQPSHHQIATYLTDYALSELVKYVMEDTGCSIEQAMERVYNSPLLTALQDEENELYVQSPAYLYELMNGYFATNGSNSMQEGKPYLNYDTPSDASIPFNSLLKRLPYRELFDRDRPTLKIRFTLDNVPLRSQSSRYSSEGL